MAGFPYNCVRLVLALLAVAAGAKPASAQGDAWDRLIAEADSIGPITPRESPRGIGCGGDVQREDSVRVRAPSAEFLLFSRSLRTRGYFSSMDVPSRGTARFALREILCDPESGRPFTFVLERDHRYFYLVFNLTDPPTYETLRFLKGFGETACVGWEQSTRRFGPKECQAAPGPKC